MQSWSFSKRISYDLNQNKVGKEFKVIVDRKEEGQYIGRTEYDSPKSITKSS